jgi:hypothetical protein
MISIFSFYSYVLFCLEAKKNQKSSRQNECRPAILPAYAQQREGGRLFP